MPFADATFGRPATCRIEHGKAPYAASLHRLLTVPPSKGERKLRKGQGRGAAPPQPPGYYTLTLEDMRVLEYPVPVRPAADCARLLCFTAGREERLCRACFAHPPVM